MRKLDCNQVNAVFLDIRKAYDTIDRNVLWNKFLKQPDTETTKFIYLIKNLFNCNITKLVTLNEVSEEKYLAKGILQGSKISPILFNIFIDDAASVVNSKTNDWNSVCLMYADDLVIVNKTKKSAECAIKKLENYAIQNKFEFNTSKCKYLAKSNLQLKLNGSEIEQVERFCYLGMIFDIKGVKLQEQLRNNFAKTKRMYYKLKNMGMLKNEQIDKYKQILILKMFIFPRIEYGIQFLCTGKSTMKKIKQEQTCT
jgi:hypothetical protein